MSRDGHIVLPRREARIKVESIRRAWFYYRTRGGAAYERAEENVRGVIRAFIGSRHARCVIRLADSQHLLTFVDNSLVQRGYRVEF